MVPSVIGSGLILGLAANQSGNNTDLIRCLLFIIIIRDRFTRKRGESRGRVEKEYDLQHEGGKNGVDMFFASCNVAVMNAVVCLFYTSWFVVLQNVILMLKEVEEEEQRGKKKQKAEKSLFLSFFKLKRIPCSFLSFF